MNEALMALLKYAFEDLNLHRIEADVDSAQHRVTQNSRTPRLSREGYLRERWQINGEDSRMLTFMACCDRNSQVLLR